MKIENRCKMEISQHGDDLLGELPAMVAVYASAIAFEVSRRNEATD